MKRILLILGLALAFVACEKEQESQAENLNELLYENSGYVKLSQNSVTFDKQKGGTITIEAEEDAFLAEIAKVTGSDFEAGCFYEMAPPDYVITLEQILKYKEFVVDGCKVVPDGFRKFTVTVEPNCDCDYIEIAISKLIETKTYGKVSGRGAGFLRIDFK